MTNFEIARRFTGMSAVDLARALEVSPQQLNSWIQGTRVPSRTNVDGIAAKMGVDAAWLLSVAQTVPVLDYTSGTVYNCPIMHSETLDGYGAFYVVWFSENDAWLPVLQGNGVQFTPWDWQGAYNPRSANEIAEIKWVDNRGQDTIMVDGLPRVLI